MQTHAAVAQNSPLQIFIGEGICELKDASHPGVDDHFIDLLQSDDGLVGIFGRSDEEHQSFERSIEPIEGFPDVVDNMRGNVSANEQAIGGFRAAHDPLGGVIGVQSFEAHFGDGGGFVDTFSGAGLAGKARRIHDEQRRVGGFVDVIGELIEVVDLPCVDVSQANEAFFCEHGKHFTGGDHVAAAVLFGVEDRVVKVVGPVGEDRSREAFDGFCEEVALAPHQQVDGRPRSFFGEASKKCASIVGAILLLRSHRWVYLRNERSLLDLRGCIQHSETSSSNSEDRMPSRAPIRIAEIDAFEGQEVTVQGWVGARRTGGRVAFVEVRDGTGRVQAVFAGDALQGDCLDRLRHLSRESAVRIHGVVRRDARSSSGFELEGHRLEELHHADEWPLTHDRSDATRIDARHLYLRSRRMGAILRLRALLSERIRSSLKQQGFLAVDAPIFTPNVVEETGTLFEAPNASAIAYLSQSGQLYNEAAAMALGRVYSFGPVFRSEARPTHRHLAEFWMVEPELAFGTLDDMIQSAETLLTAMIDAALEEGRPYLEILERDIDAFARCRGPYARMDYADAVKRAQELGATIRYGDDLNAEVEALLTRDLDRPIWVMHFPAAIKSFYMKRHPEMPDRVISADLLAPHGVGEILGGGEREESYDVLKENLRAHGLDQDAFAWYLELRKYGSVPHSGYGMGLERALVWIAGLDEIDEAIAFPRLPEQSAP